MEKKIVYTKNFERYVNSTKDWLEKQWSFDMAVKFILELYELINLIFTQPKIGSVSQKEKSVRKYFCQSTKEFIIVSTGKQ